MFLNNFLYVGSGETLFPDGGQTLLEESQHVNTPGCSGLFVQVDCLWNLGNFLQQKLQTCRNIFKYKYKD